MPKHRNHTAHVPARAVPAPARGAVPQQGTQVTYVIQPAPQPGVGRRLLARRGAGPHPVIPGELVPATGLLGKTKDQLEAEEREREQGRTWYRLRRHLVPHALGAAVAAAGGVCWLLGWITGQRGWVAFWAGLVCLGLVGIAATGFRHAFATPAVARWRTRLLAAGLAGSAWVAAVAALGPSWQAVWVLGLLQVLLGLRYWRAIRFAYPTSRPEPEPEDDEPDLDPAIEDFYTWLAKPGGILADAWVSDFTVTKVGREFTGHLVPGKQTLGHALNNLPLIAGGLQQFPDRVVIGEGTEPNEIRVKIIDRPPFVGNAYFEKPTWNNGILPIGPYIDGEGTAPYRLWTPGESGYDSDEQDGSAWSGCVIGDTGSGKSRLVEGIFINACESGLVCPWFLDPQGGVSSPAMQRYADWFQPMSGAGNILAGIDRAAEARGVQNALHGWKGFRPTPERPLLLVIIDEAHEVMAGRGDAVSMLARKIRKLGIAMLLITQVVDLSAFGGSNALRSSVMAGNGIILRTENRESGQLMPGLEVDPQNLPKIPGYFYTSKTEGSRLAPGRNALVKDPENYMADQKARGLIRPLDDYTAAGVGRIYQNRARTVDQQRELSAARMAEIMAGALDPDAPKPSPTEKAQAQAVEQAEATQRATIDAAMGGVTPTVPVPAFPVPPAIFLPTQSTDPAPGTEPRYRDMSVRDAVIAALAAAGTGALSPSELTATTGWSDSGVRKAATALVADGLVEKAAHGRYRLTPHTPADTPSGGDPGAE